MNKIQSCFRLINLLVCAALIFTPLGLSGTAPTVSAQELDSDLVGSPNALLFLLFLTPGDLIKNTEFAEVFYIDPDYKLRWITNEAAAAKHFGSDWNQKIIEINGLNELGFAFGPELKASDELPAYNPYVSLVKTFEDVRPGMLIKNKEFAEIFFVDADMSLRWIVNEQIAVKNFGENWSQIIFEFDDLSASGFTYGSPIDENYISPAELNKIYLQIEEYNYGGESEKALPLAQNLVEMDAEDANNLNYLGWTYVELGRYTEAEPLLLKAAALEPNFRAVHNNLGLLYYSTNRADLAEKAWLKAIEIAPNHARAYVNLSSLYYERGDLNKTIDILTQAIAADPSYPDSYINLSNTYVEVNQPEQAASTYLSGLDHVPVANHAVFFYGLGNSYTDTGDYDNAIKYLNQLFLLNPNHYDGHITYGYVLGKKGDTSGSIEEYKKAAQIDPSRATAHYNLGTVYSYKLNDFAAAIKEYQLVKQIDPIFADTNNLDFYIDYFKSQL